MCYIKNPDFKNFIQKVEGSEHVRLSNSAYIFINGIYEIDRYRVQTYRDIIAWVLHLCDKRWVKCQTLVEFISKALKLINSRN